MKLQFPDSKNIFLPILSVVITIYLNPSHAGTCEYMPPKMAPDWINNDPNIEGYYVGVGMSSEIQDGFDKQQEESKKRAMTDLSSNIEVSIKASYTEDQKSVTGKWKDDFEKNIQSITEITSAITLRNVQVDDVWLNRHTCTLWTRVKVKTEIADQIRDKNKQQEKLKEMEHQLALFQSNTQLAARKQTIELAQLTYNEINFSLLDTSKGKDYYAKIISDALKSILAESSKKETAESLFLNAEKQLEQARMASSPQNASEFTHGAISHLNKILADFAYNDSDSWAEQASNRLGEIERSKGNDCGAQYYYMNMLSNTHHTEWKQKANGLLLGLMCDKDKLQEFKWRKLVDGQNVLLVCGHMIGNKISEWDNVCDLVRSKLSRYGAIVETANMDNKSLLDVIAQGHNSKALANTSKASKKLVFIANGAVNSRQSEKNKGSIEYQFKGDITTFIMSGEKLDFTDKYSGIGGWNPISKEMALEVLGIHAEKRWFDKVSGSL